MPLERIRGEEGCLIRLMDNLAVQHRLIVELLFVVVGAEDEADDGTFLLFAQVDLGWFTVVQVLVMSSDQIIERVKLLE